MPKLAEIEMRLLELATADLALEPRPFDSWARQLGLNSQQVIDLLGALKARGVIRDFRAILRHQQAGFAANAMLALQVAEDRVAAVGPVLAERDWVTHCYERPDFAPYNLFAMLHARSAAELAERVAELVAAAGGVDYRVFRSLKEFKKTSMQYAAYHRRNAHE